MRLQQKNTLLEFCVLYLYFTTGFGWGLQGILYLRLKLYLLTSAYHDIENSHFHKFV